MNETGDRLTVRIAIFAAPRATFTIKLLLFDRPETITVVKTVEVRNRINYTGRVFYKSKPRKKALLTNASV